MKRLILAALFLLPLPAWGQTVTNPLTGVFIIASGGDCTAIPCSNTKRSLCRDSATSTVAWMCNGTTGFFDTQVGGGVAAGARLNLEGHTGDSYLIRDAATGFILVYLDNSLRATITPRGVIPGACPADVYSMEGGTQCYEASTGKLWVYDFRGVHEVGR